MSETAPTPKRLDTGTLIACCLAVAAAQLAITIPSPINGNITTAFGANSAQIGWVTTAFLLPTAILELNFGVVGDMFGRKKLLVLGGAVLAAGELLNVTAQSIEMLWVGQVIAGLGAAMLFPTTLAVLSAATPQPKERAKAVSRWALSISAASAAGPLWSGVIATKADWHWAFSLPVLLGVVTALLSWRLVTDTRAAEGRTLDWPGQIAVAVGLTALLWGINQGSASGWGSGLFIGAMIVAVVGLAAFVRVELRSSAPMFDMSLLRIPSFAAAAVVALFGMLGFIGTAYVVSMRLGAVMHLSSLEAGMPFVILQLIPLLLAPVLGRMLSQVNPRWLLVGGLLPMAAGQFWISALPITTTSLSAFIGPVLLLGVGFICVVSSLTAAAVNAVPIHMTGMASGATSLVREAGQALGPALVGSIAAALAAGQLSGNLTGADAAIEKAGGALALFNSPDTSDAARQAALDALGHGYSVGTVVAGIASLVGAAATLILVRGSAPQTTAAEAAEEAAVA
ncbi:MFS transporter [Streptomyces sp. NPDC007901]|uniref:MFS transporter n=1 Tax=Streptomyces sp. NPDC007901 TaxID=3364785 RepID=UPI0036EBD6B2